MTTVTTDNFPKAETDWDLERLLDDLADVKGESLTATEQLSLRRLLCGHTPAELAEMRVKDKRGQQTNLSKGIRRYVKELMKKHGMEVHGKLSSANMLAMLKKAGYKKQVTTPSNEKIITISALENLIKIVGVGNDRNEVKNGKNKMNVEIRFFTSMTAEEIMKVLTASTGKEEKGEE